MVESEFDSVKCEFDAIRTTRERLLATTRSNIISKYDRKQSHTGKTDFWYVTNLFLKVIKVTPVDGTSPDHITRNFGF